MTTFKRRPYQSAMRGAAHDALIEGYTSLLLTAATGTGKTVVFSDLTNDFVKFDWRVLILAPRRELINQAYIKIRDACCLDESAHEIEKEMGTVRFDTRAKVVVGSIQTCCKDTRLQGWTPDVIIVDEAHFVMADSYRRLFDRFPKAIKIGLTATAMRGDRQPVYHENIDGSIVQMEEKSGERDARPDECGFIKHIYDYPLEDAVNDGWLVEPRGFSVHSGVDISTVASRVNSSGDKDFSQKDLNAVLSKDQKVVVDRINKAIGRWKEVAEDRPTIVFCPSVEYSHWAADLWRQAGYTAAAIDAKTEESVRDRHLEEIHLGNVQVTCNYGIYTHGTDVDKWSCIVLLRPTESQGLLSQMLGRVTRPLNYIGMEINDLDTADERKGCIAGSAKSDSIVIDVVDIVGKHKLATLPTTLGLPANLDLQGRKLTDAAALVKEFEEVKKQVLYDCPATYEELEARLKEIDILTKSGAKYRDKWMVREDGNYSFGHAAPGYSAVLLREGDEWRLQVKYGSVSLTDKLGKAGMDAKAYFDKAAERAGDTIAAHKKAHPKGQGTIAWIQGWKNDSGKYALRDLRGANFSDAQIDAMKRHAVFPILQSIRDGRRQYA